MFNQKSSKRLSLNFWLAMGLASIILLALLSGLVMSFKTNVVLNKKIIETEEAARPADIDIIILQESSCTDCVKLKPLIDAIKKENVNINFEKMVEITSAEGTSLISKYNITKAPSVIISGEIEKDASLKAMWPQLGEIVDGVFILRQVAVPYVLTSSGEVKGRIKWTMLTDVSCNECYNVANHEIVLKQFGLPTQDQEIINANFPNGKALLKKYNIKLLPTIILTGDVKAYPALAQVWLQVGTIEEDGAYVFREGVKQMGIYKDLITNKVVRPTADQGGS